ncbi:MAG: DRTGG domain-containing protein [Thermovenabulum sp.]|uniref:DRTGG domain-containing protein n=1 Tax=Thermovenabulum sp. TaxID=3100335 RepID=UPI003C79C9A7
MTKHDRIIEYIKNLKVGSKISVRKLAKELSVSEGTAYRAIKDAQLEGLITTVPRIGTIRIEKENKKGIEELTFQEVVNIVEGSVLGGHTGLEKPLKKFLIGAMEVEDMARYIEPCDLLIVGNRKEAQILALNCKAAVLVTGGFYPDNEVIELANKVERPIITSSYDTFTVAMLINRAISSKLKQKEVILAKDVMVKNPYFLDINSKVGDWRRLLRATRHSKFPVVNDDGEVVGIATTNDVIGYPDDVSIKDVMTKKPICVSPDTPIAYAVHLMVWEGIELIPVVENKKLVGVITRQDTMKALKSLRMQPQIGETIDELVLNSFTIEKFGEGVVLKGLASSAMLNQYGVTSFGSLMTAMANAGLEAFRIVKRLETVPDTFTVYFSKPVQLGEEIVIKAEIMEIGRKAGKVEINVENESGMIAKGVMSVKVLIR